MAVSRADATTHFESDVIAGIRNSNVGVQLAGGSTAASIAAYGDAANIELDLASKGTAGVVITAPLTTISGPLTTTGELSLKNYDIAAYAADGAIDATRSHVAVLTKSSAGAYTLAAPTTDGIIIHLVAGTSFAHVTTGTDLFWGGATGGPFNKITTAAFIGSGAVVISYNSLWLVLNTSVHVTVGD